MSIFGLISSALCVDARERESQLGAFSSLGTSLDSDFCKVRACNGMERFSSPLASAGL